MDKILHVTLLYDFYGELLTDKQKLIFEMYYQNDLSFSETAQELNISRQAVCDQLKRTEKILFEYESKLHLVEKFLKHKNDVKEIKNIAQKLENNKFLDKDAVFDIESIKNIADKILD